MAQPKRQAASQSNPIDPTTGLPETYANVSLAQGTSNHQAAATAIDPNPRAVLGTNRGAANAFGNATLGTPEGSEAV